MKNLILALAPLAFAISQPASAEEKRIDGTFIQYQNWMLEMSEQDWAAELDLIRAAGIRTVIIQWVAATGREYRRDGGDPTEMILRYADAHDMDVHIGLAEDSRWWLRSVDPAYLAELAEMNGAIAEDVWKRYGGYKSFVGWYIPQEVVLYGMRDDYAAGLRDYLARMSAKCKSLSGEKPVSIAPFYKKIAPEKLKADCLRVLDGAGIDILMLQDGVGARGWDDDVECIIPMFQACREACDERGVTLWSDLECFMLPPEEKGKREPSFKPTTAERIGKQVAVVAPFVERVVTFDFFHYVSPRRGEAQKAVYEDYMKRFVNSESADVQP